LIWESSWWRFCTRQGPKNSWISHKWKEDKKCWKCFQSNCSGLQYLLVLFVHWCVTYTTYVHTKKCQIFSSLLLRQKIAPSSLGVTLKKWPLNVLLPLIHSTY
jgi:hypothetical protein